MNDMRPTILTPDLLHDYQQRAVVHQCSHPESMLFLDMGLGKTAITITSIAHLLKTGFLTGVLIVAPVRVCRLVWRQEARKWSHTLNLTFSMVMGDKDQRTRALLTEANIHIINYENIGWLSDTLHTYFIAKDRPLPFNGIVWDEVSKCKNSSTNRVKAYKKIMHHFTWATGLTGTPASNGYKDLHGQFLVVDKGKRLGVSKTAFKQAFFRKEGPYKEVAREGIEEQISQLIGDITLEMSAEEYNKLPDMIVNDIEVELPPEARRIYDSLEKEFFAQLDSGKDVEVFNEASLMNKCLQLSNGAVYPVAGMPLWENVHEAKLEALEDIIDEAQGSPVLCSYAYRSDAARIMERFKELRPINLTECKSERALNDAMRRWTQGDCRLMIGHAACLGADTQVLTERNGWVRIIDVRNDDRVFDGVEFVTHSGCSYSGYKDVIDVFGITMTPDHKLLIGSDWLEGRHVRDRQITSRQAQWWEGEVNGVGEVPEMRGAVRVDETERHQAQHRGAHALSQLHDGSVSLFDQHSHLANLARDAMEIARLAGQELRRAWDYGLSALAVLRELLRGHAGRLLGQPDHRAHRREQTIQQVELSLGNQHGAAEQQAKQSLFGVAGREDSFSRTGASIRRQQNDAVNETQPRHDGRRSSCEREILGVRKVDATGGCEATRKADVYDLVDCGPRHRFVIRNSAGEMFISHNSMGHGIDGLQKTGHIIVWFGLTWSLDLYEQMTARIRRQGQGKPVICHRIVARNTLDQAQSDALNTKATTQAGLRLAVRNYRLTCGA